MASPAMRRLAKELSIVEKQRNPQVTVRPSSKSFLEWHFVIHHLPSDSVYKDGYYHGKLFFTEQYPMAPPSVYMVTPSGRFEPYKKLCLSMTDWQPETWNPAWTVDTILVGLISLMVDVRDPLGMGAIHATADRRKRLASSSLGFNRKNPEFCELFPEFAASGSLAGMEEVKKVLRSDEAGHRAADKEEGTACWICYQDKVHERLIQPCACRGSMSGVHASCVQDWINKHRLSAVTDELPKCGVCHQAYPGTEERPGLGRLAMQLASSGLRLGVRVVMVCYVVYWYLEGAYSDNRHPTWKRLQLTIPAGVVFLYEALLLAFSLPVGHPPPPKLFASLFHSRDSTLLFELGCQMSTYLVVGGCLCATGDVELPWFLPCTILPLLPLCSLCRGLHPVELANFLSLVFLGPVQLVRFVLVNPQLCLDPDDAWFHMLVAFASMPVCWFIESSTPVLVIAAAHCSILCSALLEKIVVKKRNWTDCDVWWALIPLTALSSYNLVSCYATIAASTEVKELVWLISLLWFALVTTLALIVNSARGVRQYHAWQNRHGSFELLWEAPMKVARN